MKRTIAPIFAVLAAAGFSTAATIVDNFEGISGNWTATVSSYLTTAPATAEAIAGNGVIALDTEVGTGTPLTLSAPLLLSTWGATEVSISFTGQWGDTSSTRFFNVEWSGNNGANWSSIQQVSGSTTGTGLYSNTLTRTTGLTDQYLFRFRPKDDGSNTSDYAFYLDSVTITHNGVVPEPAAAVLGSLGALLLLRHRRR